MSGPEYLIRRNLKISGELFRDEDPHAQVAIAETLWSATRKMIRRYLDPCADEYELRVYVREVGQPWAKARERS